MFEWCELGIVGFDKWATEEMGHQNGRTLGLTLGLFCPTADDLDFIVLPAKSRSGSLVNFELATFLHFLIMKVTLCVHRVEWGGKVHRVS